MELKWALLLFLILQFTYIAQVDSFACDMHERLCRDGKQCLPLHLFCDGEEDCDDGSDEDKISCPPKPCHGFRCKNDKCTLSSFTCDGHDDCGDNSDEDATFAKCEHPTTAPVFGTNSTISTSAKATNHSEAPVAKPTPKSCKGHLFLCKSDGKCIHPSFLCEGEHDCADGEDESKEVCGKQTCSPSQFACKNGRCIRSNYRCDSFNDCSDNSDEENCPTIPPLKCTAHTFRCNVTGVCIEEKHVCDGKTDCPNGEDEPSNCGKNECLSKRTSGCSQNCTDLKIGYKCSCERGFDLLADNKTCVNINECQQRGFCSQKCIDLQGSYKCLCLDGYILDGNKRTCRASGHLPELLVAMRTSVYQIRVDGKDDNRLVPHLSATNLVSLGVDTRANVVYLADYGSMSIMRVSLDTEKVEHIVTKVSQPQGIAFDWISKKIYWSSYNPKFADPSFIEVSNADGSSRLVLVHSNISRAKALAVHPVKRLLFWTDSEKHQIERVSMDGLQRRVVIDSDQVQGPNALAIDYTSDRIFWVDEKRNYIGSSNLEGSDVVIVARDIKHPRGLAVFEDNIYWANVQLHHVLRANKFTGSNKLQYKEAFIDPMALQIMHPLLQQNATSQCNINNGGCSHLCLLSAAKPEGYSCACPTNVTLFPDGKTCDIEHPTTAPVFGTNSTISTSAKEYPTTTPVFVTKKKVSHTSKIPITTTEYPTTTPVFVTKKKVSHTSTISTATKAQKKGSTVPRSTTVNKVTSIIPDLTTQRGDIEKDLGKFDGSRRDRNKVSHTPLIAGIIAGIACIVLIVIVIALIIYRRKRGRSNLSITFHQGEEFLGLKTFKLNSTGNEIEPARKNFDNINFISTSEKDELITDPRFMNVPDDSLSGNESTCDEAKLIKKQLNSSSNSSFKC